MTAVITFSVVIPLYNKEPYVARAIASVQAQTVRDFEIIVVDDDSTDGSTRAVELLAAPGLRLIRQDNAGVSAARNRGIREARGRWIAFLDADDLWKPDYLETMSGLMERYPAAGAYAAGYEVVLPDGSVVSPRFPAIPPAPWEGTLARYFRASLAHQPVCSSATTVPRRIFEELGGFAEGVSLGEDLDMWGRIALRYPIAFSTRVGACYFKYDPQLRGAGRRRLGPRPEPHFLQSARKAMGRGEVAAGELPDLLEYLAKIRIDLGYCTLLEDGDPSLARSILLLSAPRTLALSLRKYRLLLQTLLPASILRLMYGKPS